MVLAATLALTLAVTAGDLPFAPGEQMAYSVRYLGMQVGRGSISIGDAEGSVLPVFLEAHTTGVGGIVPIREELATYLDEETLLPRRFSIDAHEGSYHRVDTIDFDREANKATVKQEGKRESIYVLDVAPDTIDFVGMVFRLRALPLSPGARHQFVLLAGRKLNTIVAEVLQRETVRTRAGTFSTLKIRVPTGFSGKFQEKSPTFLWLSDDARRVIVQITTDFAIGRAVATLASYRPGGPRLGEQ